ncbi:MAG: hypothetical protein WD341_19530 [Tistlia sp.]|uniref:hypothetical protein n=1 Tax=Tistlia sp. TaxID=3057121 RepID=UPI0034A247C5
MTASESHAKRTNRAAGTISPRQLAEPAEFKRRKVPTDLDARTFAHRVGVTPETGDEALKGAAQAFAGLSRVLDQLYGNEFTIRADGSRTTDQHILRIGQMVEKSSAAPLPALDRARKRLDAEIAAIDGEIDAGLRSRLSHEERAEIRRELKILSRKARGELIASDADIAAAALSGKAFLSGMSQAEAEGVQHTFLAKHFGEQQARRAKLDRAVEELDAGGQRYLLATFRLRDGRTDEIASRAAAADKALKEPIGGHGDE